MIFDKGAVTISEEMTAFSTNGLGKMGYSHAKKMKLSNLIFKN